MQSPGKERGPQYGLSPLGSRRRQPSAHSSPQAESVSCNPRTRGASARVLQLALSNGKGISSPSRTIAARANVSLGSTREIPSPRAYKWGLETFEIRKRQLRTNEAGASSSSPTTCKLLKRTISSSRYVSSKNLWCRIRSKKVNLNI